MAGLNDILGNELIKVQLDKAMEHDRLPHAYLLTGEKGIGKKTLVEAFLLELFCEHRSAEEGPCLNCPSCKKIISRNHPDIIYLHRDVDREGKEKDSYSVDNIREQLVDEADVRPLLGRYKVFVVPEADRMTVQAQNALLKKLEEPPEYVLIFLLASDEHELIPTIRSRVVTHKMRPLTDSVVRDFLLQSENADEELADVCVAFSKGNLGRALSLYTSEEFGTWYMRVIRICRGIRSMDSVTIMNEIKQLRAECPDIQEALDLFLLWYRDLIMYKVTKDMNGLVFRNERKALMENAAICSTEGLQEIMEDIETCSIRLRANVNPDLALELLFLNMKEK